MNDTLRPFRLLLGEDFRWPITLSFVVRFYLFCRNRPSRKHGGEGISLPETL